MDRFDELLLKARAEMMGQTPTRNKISKQDAFDMAWDITKRRTQMAMGFAQRAKEAEAKRQAKEAKRQERANRPSLLDRAKGGYRTIRPKKETTPTADPNFVDFMGQQGGLETPQATRVSGSPRTFNDFMGQQGGLETPQALDPEDVPMREDINTEQPPAPTPAPTPAPVETERAQSLPPTMRPGGITPSDRARNFGAPKPQKLLQAFQSLGMSGSDAQLRVNDPEKREVGRQRAEPTRPLDSADIPAMPQQDPLSAKTQGQLGSREDAEANQRYQDASDKRMQYAEAMERFVGRGDMTEDEAFALWEQMQQSGNIPQVPKMKEQSQPTLNEANRMLGGETLSQNEKREAVEPTREETTTQEYKRPINEKHLPVPTQKPRNTALSTRGEEKIEPLDKIPMRDGSVRQLESGSITNPLQLGQGRSPPQLTEGGEQRTSQAKAGRKLERPNPNIIDNFTRPKRKRTPKKKEPKPQQVEEQSEPVEKPKPQVEEQATELPTARQTTLFGGDAQSAPVKGNNPTATTEQATQRSERRRNQKTPKNTEATTQVGGEKGGAKEESTPMKAIRNMSSEEVGSLILDAQEGKKEAISHIKNNMDEVERVHPQFMDEMTDLFGETFKMSHDTNLSLLPSGMRNSLLKDNNADVNYSLLPNGWV